MPRDHGRVFFFAAECSSRFRLHNAHLFFRQSAKDPQSFVNVEGALQRTPHGNPGDRVEDGNHSVVFNVEMLRAPVKYSPSTIKSASAHTRSMSPLSIRKLLKILSVPQIISVLLSLSSIENIAGRESVSITTPSAAFASAYLSG